MNQSTPLRLLYFAGKYFPGSMAIRMHTDLLDELRTHGIDTTIVSLSRRDQPTPVEYTTEDEHRVIRFNTVASLADRSLNAISKSVLHYDFFLSGARRLASVIRQEQFIIAQGQMAYPYGAMLAAALDLTRRPAPLFLNLAGGDLINSPAARYGYARYASVRQVLRYAFQRAAVVRANSPVMVERARELGCPADRLHVVPSNISTSVLPPGPLAAFRKQCRARLLVDQNLVGGPILLAVGRITPIKGFDWLVRALPALTTRWPGLMLLIAGPTVSGEEAYAAGLQIEAEQLGVGARLRLLGPRTLTEMRDLYAAADLLVVPTLFEGLNKAAIEAGANGTPCIVTDSTGIVPYITQHEAGLVVPPRDPAALAAAVSTLLTNTGRWTACAEGAHRMAAEFTPAAIARALLPLYASATPPDHPWRTALPPDLALLAAHPSNQATTP